MDFSTTSFLKEVSRARTFGFMRDLEKLLDSLHRQEADRHKAALEMIAKGIAELKKNRSADDRKAIDEFDQACDHLIVRDLKSGDVVGTYRLMRGAQARRHSGFYSEKEFDLSRVKKLDG